MVMVSDSDLSNFCSGLHEKSCFPHFKKGRQLVLGVVEVGTQRSEGDLWPVGEWAISAGSVGGVECKH